MGMYLNLRKISFTLDIGNHKTLDVKYGVQEIDDIVAERYPSLFKKVNVNDKPSGVINREEKPTVVESDHQEIVQEDEPMDTLDISEEVEITAELIVVDEVLKAVSRMNKTDLDSFAKDKYGVELDARQTKTNMLDQFETELKEMNLL